MCMKFTKRAMQGSLGDIGRHGDNLDDIGGHRYVKELLDDIGQVDSGHEDY